MKPAVIKMQVRCSVCRHWKPADKVRFSSEAKGNACLKCHNSMVAWKLEEMTK